MAKYYILSVDSFQDTFTRMDATKTFSLEFSVQSAGNVLDIIEPGDCLLVYRKSPMSGVHVYMQVKSTKNGTVKLEKN